MVEIQAEPNAVLDSITEREFLRHSQQYYRRWDRCMNSEEQYFERERPLTMATIKLLYCRCLKTSGFHLILNTSTLGFFCLTRLWVLKFSPVTSVKLRFPVLLC